MPQIPTAADIPQVPARAGRAVRVPQTRSVGAGLAQIGTATTQIAQQISERNDALGRDSADTEFAGFLSNQLTKLQQTSDLALDETIQGAMTGARNEVTRLLADHGGSSASRTMLANALNRRSAQHAATLGQLNVDAAITQRQLSFDSRVRGIAVGAASDLDAPIAGFFDDVDEAIAFLGAPPAQARAMSMIGKEEIARSRIQRFITLGATDRALAFIDNPEFDEILSPSIRRELSREVIASEATLTNARRTGEAFRQQAIGIHGPEASEETIVNTALGIAGVDGGRNLTFFNTADGVFGFDPVTGEVRSRLVVTPAPNLVVKEFEGDLLVIDKNTGEEVNKFPGVKKAEVETTVVKGTVIVTDKETGEEIARHEATRDLFEIIDSTRASELGFEVPEGVIFQRNIDTKDVEVLFTPTTNRALRQERIDEMTPRVGGDVDLATDIVDGNLKVRFTESGEFFVTNVATGEVQTISIVPSVKQQAEIAQAEEKLATIRERTPNIRQMIQERDVTGLSGAITSFGMRTVGQFITFGPESQETVFFQQFIEAATNELLLATVNNPKFPVAEVERIKKELNVTARAIDSREAFLARADAVANRLATRLQKHTRDANNPAFAQEDRSNWKASAQAQSDFLATLGYDELGQPLESDLLPSAAPALGAGEFDFSGVSDEELLERLRRASGSQ